MGAHKSWVSNPPWCASACVNGTVDHMTHQTRCQSKLMTKPFMPFFKKSFKLVTEQKPSCNWNARRNLYQLQHRNWYKRSMVWCEGRSIQRDRSARNTHGSP